MEVSMEVPTDCDAKMQQGPHDESSAKKRTLFSPPLALQRYNFVANFITNDPSVLSVTDVGCGNGRLMVWLKGSPELEKINFIDKDFYFIDYEKDYYMRPNFHDMLFGRKNSKKKLEINLFHGDIIVPDDRLKADLFSLVEMIEHLTYEDLEKVCRVVFGYYQPRIVIVTTPNKEFNCLLRQPDESPDKYRHFDHKFEWTRAEFVVWTEKICSIYNYQVQLDGVGKLPNSEPYGPCTQIAIFRRNFVPQKENVESCLDLLINKLNVRKEDYEFCGDRELKKVCLINQFILPGSTENQFKFTENDFWPVNDST